MAKTKTLVTLIREIVKAEVQKEVKKIFIKENVKNASVKPKRKESKEVSYTKNLTLNKILMRPHNLKNLKSIQVWVSMILLIWQNF